LGDQIKENEMGEARSTCGREDRYMQGFGEESLGKETTYKTRRRREYNIKMDLQEVGWGVMGLHRPVSGKGKAFLNAVMYFRIP
jgi:hypothetical protein